MPAGCLHSPLAGTVCTLGVDGGGPDPWFWNAVGCMMRCVCAVLNNGKIRHAVKGHQVYNINKATAMAFAHKFGHPAPTTPRYFISRSMKLSLQLPPRKIAGGRALKATDPIFFFVASNPPNVAPRRCVFQCTRRHSGEE